MATLQDYRKDLEKLTNETLLLCGDPYGERFHPDRVAEAVNHTILEFNLETEMIKEEINIQCKENVHEYDVRRQVEEDGTLRRYTFPLRVGFGGRENTAFSPVSLFDVDTVGYDSAIWYRNSMSAGHIAIIPPSEDGNSLSDPDDPYYKNIQVLYVGEPEYMTKDDDYPDSKMAIIFHQAIPHGASSRLLDEGDLSDLDKAIERENEFYRWIAKARTEQSMGNTQYGGCEPL